MIMYEPNTANEIQGAKTGGEALQQMPGTMQSLYYDQTYVRIFFSLYTVPVCSLIVAKNIKEKNRERKRQYF